MWGYVTMRGLSRYFLNFFATFKYCLPFYIIYLCDKALREVTLGLDDSDLESFLTCGTKFYRT